MNLKCRHIISACLLLCGLLGLASCVGESLEPLHEEEDDDIYLTFHTAVAGASTRADGGTEADDVIHRLLVVIVSKEDTGWMVERSRPIIPNASIGIPLYNEYTFKVKSGRKKRIYLIANYEGLKDAEGAPLDFGSDSFLPKTEDGKAPIEKFVFALNSGYGYSTKDYGIPMTAMYEITVPDKEELATDKYTLKEKLYVVRAATKYSFSFANTSANRNIKVTSAVIKNVITDRMYLMPHVNKETAETDGKGKYWVVSRDDSSGDPSKRYLSAQTEADSWFTGREWIDWLAAEAERTNGEAALPDASEEWLTDYEVPPPSTPEGGEETPGNGTAPFEMEFTAPVEVPANTTEGNPVAASRYFYLPESRSQKDKADVLKLQEYTLTIHTKETFEGDGKTAENGAASGGNEVTRSYTATLPHLGSLFRNTHVKVNITFNDYTINWQVDVEPYWEVKLEPEFGL